MAGGGWLGVSVEGTLEEEVARIGALPAGQGPCSAGAGVGVGANDRALGGAVYSSSAVWLFFHGLLEAAASPCS